MKKEIRKKRSREVKIKKILLLVFVFVALISASVFVWNIFGVRAFTANKLITKGNFYFNGGAYDLDKAAKFYKAAAFIDHNVSYTHYQLARVDFLKTDYKDALTEIDRALALNPENQRAYYIRGLIDGYAENYKASEDDFKKFIAWAPKEWAGYNDLAWAYYKDKDYQNAADAAQNGLEVMPNNAWLLNGLGVSLQALGKNDEAKIALDKSAELAKSMTAADWKRAYPGNDAGTAEWDLAQFKTDVNYNLGIASAYNVPLGKGKFQPACAASQVKICQGASCSPVNCDAGHSGADQVNHIVGATDPETGLPYCDEYPTTCENDCGCAPPVWPPNNCYTPPNAACSFASCVGSGNPPGPFAAGPGDITGCNGAGSGNKCCVLQASNCGTHQCVAQDPCVTPPGTCSISLSPNPVNLSSSATSRTLTATRSDGQSGKTISFSFSQSNSRFSLSSGSCTTGAGGSCGITVSATGNDFSSNASITINASPEGCTGGGVAANIAGSTPACPACGNSVCDCGETSASCPGDCPPGPGPSSCSCGSANGSNLCNGWPSDGDLCNSPDSPSAKNPGGTYGDWTWKCCSGATSCSAKGPGFCGWIETNP